jgi:hypothetical protein
MARRMLSGLNKTTFSSKLKSQELPWKETHMQFRQAFPEPEQSTERHGRGANVDRNKLLGLQVRKYSVILQLASGHREC